MTGPPHVYRGRNTPRRLGERERFQFRPTVPSFHVTKFSSHHSCVGRMRLVLRGETH
jgi:hypothetical protein